MEQYTAAATGHLLPSESIAQEDRISFPFHFEFQAFAISNTIREVLDAIHERNGNNRPVVKVKAPECWTINSLIEHEVVAYQGPAGTPRCSLAVRALLKEIAANHYFCPKCKS